MKLMRVGPKGSEKPALLDAAGTLRDLSGELADITAASLSPAGTSRKSNLGERNVWARKPLAGWESLNDK